MFEFYVHQPFPFQPVHILVAYHQSSKGPFKTLIPMQASTKYSTKASDAVPWEILLILFPGASKIIQVLLGFSNLIGKDLGFSHVLISKLRVNRTSCETQQAGLRSLIRCSKRRRGFYGKLFDCSHKVARVANTSLIEIQISVVAFFLATDIFCQLGFFVSNGSKPLNMSMPNVNSL